MSQRLRDSYPGSAGKANLPLLPSAYLPRTRLGRLWKELELRRVVIVEAGAGYGKTTFLAAHAAESGRRVVWYTCDSLDRDFSSFCTNLAASLDLEDSTGTEEEDASAAVLSRRMLAGLLSQLQAVPGESNIVFDDLHAVKSVPEIAPFLGDLAKLLPMGCTLFLASRESVGVPVSKLKALGQTARLSASELQFTREEAEQLFRAALPGSGGGSRPWDQLVARTEGWAAGLGICLRFLEADPGRTAEQALRRLDDAGSDWFAYLAEEVLDTLDPPLQEFLLRASLLSRLEPDLCDQAFGIRNSRELLETLHRRNLFTFPLSEERKSYRFHQLFHEFLRSRLERRVRPEEIRRLRVRLARRLAASDAWFEAAETYVDAEEPAPALALLERHAREAGGLGQPGRAIRLFDRLPPRSYAGRPRALLVLGQAYDVLGRWDEAYALYARALRAKPPVPVQAELILFQARIHNLRGDYDKCVRACRRGLALTRGGHGAAGARLHGMLGTSAGELGRHDEAEEHYERALRLAIRGKDTRSEAHLRYLLAINVHYPRGDFQAAKQAARRALVLSQRLGDRRVIYHSLGVLAFIAGGAGEEAEARGLAEDALRLAEAAGNPAIAGYARLTLGRCALLREDYASAASFFQETKEAGEALRETDLRTYPFLGLAEVALAKGNRIAARQYGDDALKSARLTRDALQEAQASTLLGSTWSSSDPARARVWWKKSERILRRIGARFELHRLLLLRLSAGDVAEADVPACLRELLTGVARMRHEPLFLVIERARSIPVLTMALRRGVEAEYAASLLTAFGEAAVPELVRLSREEGLASTCVHLLGRIGGEAALRALTPLRDPTTRTGRLAERACEQLACGPEKPLVIRTFGLFQVEVGDRRLPIGAWRSARALRLFLLLLLRRFRWSPADELVEALWPEADPDKGRNNLIQSISLLRRTLEPDLDQARLSRYVLSRPDACRLQPGEGFTCDFLRFEEILSCAQNEERAGRVAAAERLLREAIGIYSGDLVQELPYEDIVVEERERLRERYVAALAHLLTLLVRGRKFEEMVPLCKLGLKKDPYREDFHAHLVAAHLAAGNRKGALECYQRYEEALRRDLGVGPSARMREVIRGAGSRQR